MVGQNCVRTGDCVDRGRVCGTEMRYKRFVFNAYFYLYMSSNSACIFNVDSLNYLKLGAGVDSAAQFRVIRM